MDTKQLISEYFESFSYTEDFWLEGEFNGKKCLACQSTGDALVGIIPEDDLLVLADLHTRLATALKFDSQSELLSGSYLNTIVCCYLESGARYFLANDFINSLTPVQN